MQKRMRYLSSRRPRLGLLQRLRVRVPADHAEHAALFPREKKTFPRPGASSTYAPQPQVLESLPKSRPVTHVSDQTTSTPHPLPTVVCRDDLRPFDELRRLASACVRYKPVEHRLAQLRACGGPRVGRASSHPIPNCVMTLKRSGSDSGEARVKKPPEELTRTTRQRPSFKRTKRPSVRMVRLFALRQMTSQSHRVTVRLRMTLVR